MASEYSFDIVSELDLTIVANALDLAEREIANRYDFKNSKTKIQLEKSEIKITSDDEWHLETVLDVIRSKFTKREISLKSMELGKIESAAGGCVRQVVTLKQGVPVEEGREIKAAGIKVQTQIQGEAVRVTGKDKDVLQAVQKLVKSLEDLSCDVAFANYR